MDADLPYIFGDGRAKNHTQRLQMELWRMAFVCCVFCHCFSHTEAIVTLRGNETIPALILFGDSIMDTGTNNDLITAFKCNFPPYGRDFHGAQPTGRFSNGKVPSDLVGIVPFIHAKLPFTTIQCLIIDYSHCILNHLLPFLVYKYLIDFIIFKLFYYF